MRMLSAAHRKISRTGIHSNNGLISAMLRAKKDSTQKKINSVVAANAARKSQATGEEKNSLISFCAMRRTAESVAIGIYPAKQAAEVAFGVGQRVQLSTGIRDAAGNLAGSVVGLCVVLQFQAEQPVTGAVG